MKTSYISIALIFLMMSSLQAQTTSFSYQGNLVNGGTAANGNYDFEFALFDALSGGTQVGTTQSRTNVAVANGIFKVDLDFGSQFPGANRYLEIRVRTAGGGGHQILAPRQLLGSAPYAVKAIAADTAATAATATTATTAATATNATQLGGLPPSRYVQLEANGNLPIGTATAAPGYKVDINTNGGGIRGFFNGSTHFVAETTGGTNAWAKYIMKTPNRQWAIGTSQNFNSDQLYFSDDTAGQIRMAISNAGNVGIGTTAPSTKLEVVHPYRQLRFGPTAADNGGYLISTVPHQAIISGGARFNGADWIATDTTASLTAHQFGSIAFFTHNNLAVGSPFTPAARMTIFPNGQVRLGPGQFFSVARFVVDQGPDFNASADFNGNVRVYGDVFANNILAPSDARLKQNISKLGYGLSEVLRLRPVSWLWKEHPETGQQLGLVAQEVEQVLPDLVSTPKDPEEMKGLNYVGLVPVLINAVKEQQKQIERLNARLRKMERKRRVRQR